MKIKSCLEISVYEIKCSIKIFGFYSIIFICLISISISLFRAAVSIPNAISEIATDLYADCIYITADNVEELEPVLNDMEICDCSSFLCEYGSQIFGEKFLSNNMLYDNSDGIMVWTDKSNNKSATYISDNIISGNFNPNEIDNALWVSDTFADFLSLSCGETFSCLSKSEGNITLIVQGIYSSSDELKHFYYTDETYSILSNGEDKIEFLMRCTDFKKIDKVINILDNNNIDYMYNDDMIKSIKTMFASFYATNFVLFIALSGIVVYLLELYYAKRNNFFVINSIIGMSNKGMVCIFFMIIQIVMLFSVSISAVFSAVLLKQINQYLYRLFEIDFKIGGISVYSFVVNFIFLEICIFISVFRFHRKLKLKSQ